MPRQRKSTQANPPGTVCYSESERVDLWHGTLDNQGRGTNLPEYAGKDYVIIVLREKNVRC